MNFKDDNVFLIKEALVQKFNTLFETKQWISIQNRVISEESVYFRRSAFILT